ncbi:MAG: hypothetical protein AAGC81_15965 [Pseudomonadota bacterium]
MDGTSLGYDHHLLDNDQLMRAMRVAPMAVSRYEGTKFEADAIRKFERLEREFILREQMTEAKLRAAKLSGISD